MWKMNNSGLQTKMNWQAFPSCPKVKYKIIAIRTFKSEPGLPIFKRTKKAPSEGDPFLKIKQCKITGYFE